MTESLISPFSADLERVLLDATTIERRVDDLARQISRDFAHADQLMMVGVLKGAFIFLSDLKIGYMLRYDGLFESLVQKGTLGSGEDFFEMTAQHPGGFEAENFLGGTIPTNDHSLIVGTDNGER